MADQRVQTTFRIDPELLNTLRHALIERETKMTPVIEKLIREWLHGYEFKEKQHIAPKEVPEAPPQRTMPNRGEESTVTPKVSLATQPPTSAPASPDPWTRILGLVEKKINRHSYDTWLKPARYSHADGEILFVRVPTVEFRKAGDKYSDLIQEAIDDLGLGFSDVKFVTPEDDSAASPMQHHVALASALTRAAPPQERFVWDDASQLNPRYSFDAFVVGSGNRFAHAACHSVAEHPSKAYNPLFLYGAVGLGKTHLMQAIGLEIKRRQPRSAICYVSSEKFTNDMINSLRYDKMTSFRDKFREVDVLLIDDIQFLAGKDRTQEEFFHTFNALHGSMKQIVIASDRQPKELAELEDRLRSRFDGGLVAGIGPADLETKIAILQKKAEGEKVTLPADVAFYVSSRVGSNIRDLEGALIRLVAHSSLIGAEMTLPFAQQVLGSFLGSLARTVTIESIQKTVAQQFGLRLVEIKAKNNSRAIVYPRQIAMYLAKNLTEASLPEIGRQFGGKHHTTVQHSVDKIEEIRKSDKDLDEFLNKMTEQLGG